MKIAISTDGSLVSAHFGRCPHFTIIETENRKIIKKEIIPNPGHFPGAIPQFLSQKGVQVIIAGGMGMRATGFFNELGISTVTGASGKVDDVIDKFLKSKLQSVDNVCQPGAGKGYGLEKEECDHREGNEKH